ncbi:MAG: type VI secretion system baseplate subunit TssG, partial [Gemmatimonadota bacterium]|nr:type VI secretion system baseplate subunit TssG [Gemmatimonadota bacterium]
MSATREMAMEPASARMDDVARMLGDTPWLFDFFQAVHLLEQLSPERAPVGGFGDPANETVRFAAAASIAFPPSEIAALTQSPDEPARMTVNFMGLTGPQGVLPLVYSTQLIERVRARDDTMRAFFDIFNHRLISLFYRAWVKHRELDAIDADRRDAPLTRHVLEATGLGDPELRRRVGVPAEVMAFYSGLFALRTRPAAGLEQLLGDYFAVPVTVEQFIGAWYPIERDAQCALGDERDSSTQLGMGAVAGDEIWDQQGRIRIRIGPLARRQYDAFLPTGSALAELRALVRFYTSEDLDVDVQLVLARDEVPPCIIGG